MDFLEAWSESLTDDNENAGIQNLHRRVAKVSWGGRSKWWHPLFPRSSYYPLETIDGANLLYSYFTAMRPFIIDEHRVRFPRRACARGCDWQVALRQTLEWRETQQPWTVDEYILQENENGWVYTRGFAKKSPYGRHAMIWLRPGQHVAKNSTAYARAIVQTVDVAIGQALRHGRSGRVNVVIDASGLEWANMIEFGQIKRLFWTFQDHYPGRLGAVFLCHMSATSEILWSIIKSLLSPELVAKVHVLSNNSTEMLQQLETTISLKDIPQWLGGKDSYSFYPCRYHIPRVLVGGAVPCSTLGKLVENSTRGFYLD